jgi:hypothetical protein
MRRAQNTEKWVSYELNGQFTKYQVKLNNTNEIKYLLNTWVAAQISTRPTSDQFTQREYKGAILEQNGHVVPEKKDNSKHAGL